MNAQLEFYATSLHAERERLADALAHCRDVWIDARRGLARGVHVDHARRTLDLGTADALHYAMDASRREARAIIGRLRALRGVQS
ncbi:MAG: hypothetical protein V4787_11485 [Pseudomonadota bacterium]